MSTHLRSATTTLPSSSQDHLSQRADQAFTGPRDHYEVSTAQLDPFSLTHVSGRTRWMQSSNSATRKPMLGTPLVIRVPLAKGARIPTISDQSSREECSGQAEDHH
jgi:hypothetical protein